MRLRQANSDDTAPIFSWALKAIRILCRPETSLLKGDPPLCATLRFVPPAA
jgi:hypothetical protein